MRTARTRKGRPGRTALVAAAVAGLLVAPSFAASAGTTANETTKRAPHPKTPGERAEKRTKDGTVLSTVRFATYNASLYRDSEGQLVEDLSTPDDKQAQRVAEVIQRTRPDVLLLNEFDYDPGGTAAKLFQQNYLSVPQHGAKPIRYDYRFVAPSNTGIPSGHDLNNDGVVGTEQGTPEYANDAFGFGMFPGQYGMAVFSRHPIDYDAIRTFQKFRWKDMPGAKLPDDPSTPEPADYYSDAELEDLRLSSKSHWDVPIQIGSGTVHFLVSHPTPPVFDGPENRNGRRNHDEIRFWADYVRPERSDYIYDDSGRRGGLAPGAEFVIAGDMNADPHDGDSFSGAADQLVDNPRVNSGFTPFSLGAVEASLRQGGTNRQHQGNPAYDTADFAEPPGNVRVDYVLPSDGLRVLFGKVFWPTTFSPLHRLTKASDHHLVWVDVRIPGSQRGGTD